MGLIVRRQEEVETQRAAEQLLGGAGNATWDRVNLLPPVFLDIVLAASSAAPAPVLSGLEAQWHAVLLS